jgi:hypothetical protein
VLATEIVRLKVEIIVASQTPAVVAAKQATTEIPIVMAAAGDPVGTCGWRIHNYAAIGICATGPGRARHGSTRELRDSACRHEQ